MGCRGRQSSAQIKLIQVNGWPTDHNQALIYLAQPGGRLLETGCGAEQARQNLAYLPNCHILNKPLETLKTATTVPFDCVVWADVIEYVVDVIETMHLVVGLSRPGTQLVTVTPNVTCLPQRLRLLRGWAPNTGLSLHRNEGFTDDPTQTVLHNGGHLHYFTLDIIGIKVTVTWRARY